MHLSRTIRKQQRRKAQCLIETAAGCRAEAAREALSATIRRQLLQKGEALSATATWLLQEAE